MNLNDKNNEKQQAFYIAWKAFSFYVSIDLVRLERNYKKRISNVLYFKKLVTNNYYNTHSLSSESCRVSHNVS